MQSVLPATDYEELVAENAMLRRRARAFEQLIAALPVAALVAIAYVRRWVAEDAFIDFRVVRQLIAGHGPVFNIGERVEAYTNPLWVALLTIWAALGGSIEIGAVVLGIVLSALGLITAMAGATALARRRSGQTLERQLPLVLPVGAAVYVALPPAWDFASSGLETGLTIAWLGVSFWSLVRIVGAIPAPSEIEELATKVGSQRAWLATSCLIGLGPLIRPDLAFFSVAFLGTLLLGYYFAYPQARQPGAWVKLVVAALAIPVAYQLFRMGYFASVVPNTSLAKEGTGVYWGAGGVYFGDFVETYSLWIPLSVLLTWWALRFLRSWSERCWLTAALTLGPVLAALVSVLFVVRVGGDFMHGRMLLPSLFGVLLPMSSVVVPLAGRRAWVAIGACLTIGLWVIVAAAWMRVPYTAIGPDGVADERDYWLRCAGNPNPVTIEDYKGCGNYKEGLVIRERAQQEAFLRTSPDASQLSASGAGSAALLLDIRAAAGPPGRDSLPVRASAVPPDVKLVINKGGIGISGYAAGLAVHVVDRNGLSDPLGSRLRLGKRLGRPAHEKELPPAWIVARYTDPSVQVTDLRDLSAARQALSCGDLPVLLQAITEPITLGRFLENISLSWRLSQFRFWGGPADAQRELCSTR